MPNTQLPPLKHLILEGQETVHVTLDRPQVRNALNAELIRELQLVFDFLSQNAQCRLVILQGSGKSFCAGADLNWMKSMVDYSLEENIADASQLAKMYNAVYTCKKPVVAKIQGDAYAGGIGLIAACDIVVCASTAKFCISEAKLGLIPATISPYLFRSIGEQACKRYFLTAEVFSAATAKSLGLVHEIAEPQQLDTAVKAIAQSIRANDSAALSACKDLIHDLASAPLSPELINETVERIARVRISPSAQSRMASFLENSKK